MENDDYGWAFMFEVMIIAAGGYLAHKMALLENTKETLDDIHEQVRESKHGMEAAKKRYEEALERKRICDLKLKKAQERLDKYLEKKRLRDLKMEKIAKKMRSSTLENGHEEDANTD